MIITNLIATANFNPQSTANSKHRRTHSCWMSTVDWGPAGDSRKAYTSHREAAFVRCHVTDIRATGRAHVIYRLHSCRTYRQNSSMEYGTQPPFAQNPPPFKNLQTWCMELGIVTAMNFRNTEWPFCSLVDMIMCCLFVVKNCINSLF